MENRLPKRDAFLKAGRMTFVASAILCGSAVTAQTAAPADPNQSLTTPPAAEAPTAPPAAPESSITPVPNASDVASPPGTPPLTSAAQAEADATPAAVDVQQLLAAVAGAVLAPDPAQPLAGLFASSDQKRLEALNKTSPLLGDVVAQLQKAFEEKYGAKLDLRQNQQAVFPEDSFRIGVAMAVLRDEPEDTDLVTTTAPAEFNAQQAAATAVPDGTQAPADIADATSARDPSSPAPASPTPGQATAAPDGVANLNAAPKLTRRISVTVPESSGLPETGLKLVNQQDGWKIDVPNGVTAQSLEQDLQAELQRAISMQWPEDPNAAGQLIARHVLLALASEGSTGQVGSAAPPVTPPQPERVAPAPRPNTAGAPAEPATRPVRQTYRERREAERAEREAKRAAEQQEREQKRQQQQPQAQPAPQNPTAPAPEQERSNVPRGRSGAY